MFLDLILFLLNKDKTYRYRTEKIDRSHMMPVALNGLTTFLCEKKQRNIRKKSDENLQKRRFSAFSPGKEFFSKIGLSHVFSTANGHLYGKNQKKLIMKSQENAEKLVFLAYFRKSGSVTFWALPFCSFVPKIRKN